MESNDVCSFCGARVELGTGFVVRVDVYADPEIPPMTAEQIASTNLDKTLAEVIEQARRMSADELQNGVYRRFEYRLCPPCHRRYLEDPLGKRRRVR